MANREVNLTKRVVTQQGKRYCPAVLAANGRIKPDFVVVNRKAERHPEGAYYISWYEGSRLKRLSVGKDAQDAANQRLRKEAELNAVNNGVNVLPDKGNNGSRSLTAAIASYLDEVQLTHLFRVVSCTEKRAKFVASTKLVRARDGSFHSEWKLIALAEIQLGGALCSWPIRTLSAELWVYSTCEVLRSPLQNRTRGRATEGENHGCSANIPRGERRFVAPMSSAQIDLRAQDYFRPNYQRTVTRFQN
jgi:hypothetical protein